jgi:aldehyde:ferredoxin oxidoreductase
VPIKVIIDAQEIIPYTYPIKKEVLAIQEENKVMKTHAEKAVFGWRGKILRVDLTKSAVRDEQVPDIYLDNYIGGSGINARLLYDLMHDKPHTDPLDPENPIIFGCGPMVGTRFPCASRFTVTAKSPLTGIFGDTNAGGWFPVRLKQIGYDHIIIKGKAPHPVIILIEKDTAPKIIDAREYWGLDIYDTDMKLREKYGSCETARIGPAGENLVKYANIVSGSKRISTNGRTGMGCVMGAKNLKAIVLKGTGTVPVAHEHQVESLSNRYRDIWYKGPGTTMKREYGTLTLMSLKGEAERIKNDQEYISSEQLDAYDLEDFKKKYKTGQTACYRCPVACSQKWSIKEGKYSGDSGDKVEYGHMYHLGPLLGIFDFAAMLHLSDICNRMGMDCIQFGYNTAMVMECLQRGLLGIEETGGIRFEWGDAQVVEQMMYMTAKREGFGDVLAEGASGMIARLGPDTEPYGSHIKGMSFTYSCTYGVPMSLASSVATRGGDHLKGHPFAAIIGHQEMLEKMFGKDIPEEIADHTSPVAKGRVVWWQENFKMIMDCLGICFLPIINSNVWSEPLIMTSEMGEMYQSITGRDPSGLFNSAERAYQIERCFNALLGITRKDDAWKGSLRGGKNPINHPGMLDEYYHYRGCSGDGLPTRKRLEEIGLHDVAETLQRFGKLSDECCPDIEELIKHSTDRAGKK